MWCSHCQSEVRPVISLAGNPPRCSVCGHEFHGLAAPPRTAGEAPSGSTPRDAQPPRLSPQDLLARWAREETLPPFELGTGQPAASGPLLPSQPWPPPPPPQSPPRGPAVARFDASHPLSPQPVSLPEQIAAAPPTPPVSAPHFSLGAPSHRSPHPPLKDSAGPAPAGRNVASREVPTAAADFAEEGPPFYSEVPIRHQHAAHASIRPPHFAWEPVPPPERASNSWRAAAQIFVLAGVVGLTVGTLILLYTHFWSTETDSLLPLGYVIAACSQLVLLLGVVQHISLGLEQAEQTMNWRVAHLGERLQRMEAAAGSKSREQSQPE
jgi:hypothetical protein